MKKILVFLCVVGFALMFVAAKLPGKIKSNQKTVVKKNTGCGYRIIEFGVGIDCNGDTVKLTKSKGFQHRLSEEKSSHASV